MKEQEILEELKIVNDFLGSIEKVVIKFEQTLETNFYEINRSIKHIENNLNVIFKEIKKKR